MISWRDWWPWTKACYVTMTRRQSNNQWSGDIAVHPAPKNSECKNPLKNFSPRFFGIKTTCSSFIIFQRARLSMWSITHFCWCNWRTFWRKNATASSPRGSCSCTTWPVLPNTCNPEETDLPGIPLSWSPTLFSGYGPFGQPSVPWSEKTIEISPFFVRRGGHSCHGDPVGWKTVFFLSGLQKLEQQAKKSIEIRGEYVWSL